MPAPAGLRLAECATVGAGALNPKCSSECGLPRTQASCGQAVCSLARSASRAEPVALWKNTRALGSTLTTEYRRFREFCDA